MAGLSPNSCLLLRLSAGAAVVESPRYRLPSWSRGGHVLAHVPIGVNITVYYACRVVPRPTASPFRVGLNFQSKIQKVVVLENGIHALPFWNMGRYPEIFEFVTNIQKVAVLKNGR